MGLNNGGVGENGGITGRDGGDGEKEGTDETVEDNERGRVAGVNVGEMSEETFA